MRDITNLRDISYPSNLLSTRVRLHYTWLFAFLLVAIIVATQFSEAYPLWESLALGAAAWLALFIILFVRQFALNLVARRRGILVGRVTLYIFGGAAEIVEATTLPALETLMAALGLLSNLVIAVVLYLTYLLLITIGNVTVAALAQWLAFITFALTLFHFIPAFPLEGGRMFRAALWQLTGNYDLSTRIAGWMGQLIGLALFLGGLYIALLGRQWFVGLMLALVGWALYRGATRASRVTFLHRALHGVTVGDVMLTEYPAATPELSIGELVRRYSLATGYRYFVLVDDVGLSGVVTIRDVKRIRKKRWDSTIVGKIMTPAPNLKAAHPGDSAANMLQEMEMLDISGMPVLAGDKLVGIITRENLTRVGRTRAELGM
ncbi:MAG: CBS domain-containing protein [Chloroflexota bacterium]